MAMKGVKPHRYNRGLHAGVAQLVEQRIRNAKVGSSTLLTGTNRNKPQSPAHQVGLCRFWASWIQAHVTNVAFKLGGEGSGPLVGG